MDKLVPFLINRNEDMIAVLLWSICGVMGLWFIIFLLRSNKKGKAKSIYNASDKELENLVIRLEEKIVARDGLLASVSAAAHGTGDAGAGGDVMSQAGAEAGTGMSASEMNRLVRAQEEIKELKQRVEKFQASHKVNSELQDKINELEAKLLEYEIIEEDIADLSRYRDENEELRKEIESLKGGSAEAPAPVADNVIPMKKEPEENKQTSSQSPQEEKLAETLEDLGDDNFFDDDLAQALLDEASELSSDESADGEGKAIELDSMSDMDSLAEEAENFLKKESS